MGQAKRGTVDAVGVKAAVAWGGVAKQGEGGAGLKRGKGARKGGGMALLGIRQRVQRTTNVNEPQRERNQRTKINRCRGNALGRKVRPQRTPLLRYGKGALKAT